MNKQLYLQRRAVNQSERSDVPPIVHEVLRTPGSEIDRATRDSMELHFGYDFGKVKVHTDSRAAESASATNALAYTVGNDIVFGSNKYAPRSHEGRRLLAHELTHVVQQGPNNQSIPNRISNVSDPHEREAEIVANNVMQSRKVMGISRNSSLILSRNGGPIMTGTNNPAQNLQDQDTPTSTSRSPTVYICAIDLQTSPVGRHALFRIGDTGPGNETLSLQPFDQGGDCWQGIPLHNDPFDMAANADCEATSISADCLQREFSTYPVGHYCTWGPNSNTFVGSLAKKCGLDDPDPPGWTPGIDESPPPFGTFAPDKWTTLGGCETKICITDRPRRPNEPILV